MANINVSTPERIVSVLAGAFLLFRAFKNQNLGIINGGAAGFLLYRGLSGYCPGYAAMGRHLPEEDQPVPTPMADPVEDPNVVNKIVTP